MKKPKGIFFWSNKKINLFGALIDGRKLYYKWSGSMNTLSGKSFLSAFVETLPKGKYVFILDNAPYHKSSTIIKYLNSLENIKVEFLPPYSPELNPTETCWKTIRSNVTNSTYFPTLEEMQRKIEKFLDEHQFEINVSNYLCC